MTVLLTFVLVVSLAPLVFALPVIYFPREGIKGCYFVRFGNRGGVSFILCWGGGGGDDDAHLRGGPIKTCPLNFA